MKEPFAIVNGNYFYDKESFQLYLNSLKTTKKVPAIKVENRKICERVDFEKLARMFSIASAYGKQANFWFHIIQNYWKRQKKAFTVERFIESWNYSVAGTCSCYAFLQWYEKLPTPSALVDSRFAKATSLEERVSE